MPSIGHIVTPIPVGTRDSPQLSLIFRYRERQFREIKQYTEGNTANWRPKLTLLLSLWRMKVSFPSWRIADVQKFRDSEWWGHRFSLEGINGWSWVTSPSVYANNGATDVIVVWPERKEKTSLMCTGPWCYSSFSSSRATDGLCPFPGHGGPPASYTPYTAVPTGSGEPIVNSSGSLGDFFLRHQIT